MFASILSADLLKTKDFCLKELDFILQELLKYHLKSKRLLGGLPCIAFGILKYSTFKSQWVVVFVDVVEEMPQSYPWVSFSFFLLIPISWFKLHHFCKSTVKIFTITSRLEISSSSSILICPIKIMAQCIQSDIIT